MKYRKKPVVIDAFKWTGGPDQTEDPEWLIALIKSGDVRLTNVGTLSVVMDINTLEGTMRARLGDYIIRGIKGEVYPCKPDIFEAMYDLATAPTDVAKLRKALVALVGSDNKEELEKMEDAMRILPMPEEDRINTINAIHALLDTL